MRRLLTSINEIWEYHRGIPLFEFVQENGSPWVKGEKRYIRLKDVSVRTTQIGNLALMPAFLQFMRILRGTHFEHEFKDLFSGSHIGLNAKDRVFLRQAQSKFYYVAKGIKDYRSYSEQIGAIYKGLLSNRLLGVRRSIKGGDRYSSPLRLMPLTLVSFNSGLYLLARNPDNPELPPKKYRVETLEKVECLDETFEYPSLFNPERYFGDSFGIYSGEEPENYEVRIALLTPDVEEYVRHRRWTNQDRYECKDGVSSISFVVKDLVEVTSWVLSFGDKVQVLAPRELRDAVREKLVRAQALYSER
jgi:hypothetical protein